jgi:hypothetical protein
MFLLLMAACSGGFLPLQAGKTMSMEKTAMRARMRFMGPPEVMSRD